MVSPYPPGHEGLCTCCKWCEEQWDLQFDLQFDRMREKFFEKVKTIKELQQMLRRERNRTW